MLKIAVTILLIGGTLLYAFFARKNLQSQIGQNVATESLLTTMPQNSFEELQGSEYQLQEQLKQSGADLVLVHFWATWCGPCEAELPELMRFVSSLPNSGKVLVLVVAVNDEVPKVQKFMKRIKVTNSKKIVWLIDNKNVHRDSFGTTKLPESYLFSSEGRFLRKLLGPQQWEKPMFLDMFALYLH